VRCRIFCHDFYPIIPIPPWMSMWGHAFPVYEEIVDPCRDCGTISRARLYRVRKGYVNHEYRQAHRAPCGAWCAWHREIQKPEGKPARYLEIKDFHCHRDEDFCPKCTPLVVIFAWLARAIEQPRLKNKWLSGKYNLLEPDPSVIVVEPPRTTGQEKENA